MFRFETAGESHGECLVATLTGLPAGIPIAIDAINHELWRRQQGFGRGGRMKIETDRVSYRLRRPPRPHHRLAHRHDHRQCRLEKLDRIPARRSRRSRAPQASLASAARPCRSRRRHQIQLSRRPLHPRTRQRPRNHRPRRRRGHRQTVSRRSSASKFSAT